MSAPEIPLARRVALVRARIARCEHAEEQTRRSDTTGEEIAAAFVELARAEHDFGQEWRDVKAILEALCPTP